MANSPALNPTLAPTESDHATARRFLDGCYDDSLKRPNRAALERLVALGWIEPLPEGGYAETPALREVGLY